MERETLVKKIITAILFCVIGFLLPYILRLKLDQILIWAKETDAYLFAAVDVCLFAIAGIFVNSIAKGMSRNIKVSFFTLCVRELAFILLGISYNAIVILNRIDLINRICTLDGLPFLGAAYQWSFSYFITSIWCYTAAILFIIILIYMGYLIFNLYTQWNKVRNSRQTQF